MVPNILLDVLVPIAWFLAVVSLFTHPILKVIFFAVAICITILWVATKSSDTKTHGHKKERLHKYE